MTAAMWGKKGKVQCDLTQDGQDRAPQFALETIKEHHPT